MNNYSNKSLQTIDKSNQTEMENELFKRKHELMNMKIQGSLKKDTAAVTRKKVLLEECQKITMMLSLAKRIAEEKAQALIDKDVVNQIKKVKVK